MKAKFFILFGITLFFLNPLHSQNAEKLTNTKQVYLYLLGVGAGYEQPIANQFSVLTSVNYNTGFMIGNDDLESLFTLGFAVEPRYYYNFNKRNQKGKNTKHNASNYFSTEVSYFPDLLSYSSKEGNVKVTKHLSISPMWNIRRNIAQSNFNYEVGIGFKHYKNYYSNRTVSDNSIALNLKVGYNF